MNALIFLKGGFVFRALYAAVKNFISERTRKKFVFTTNDDYLNILLEKMDLDQIPRDYGGTG